ncbi:TPA: hypothetical protein PXD63_003595 [Pseudomonas aeruginosa]|nr:hypothetical protein [Pseudomonas aeruginosa]
MKKIIINLISIALILSSTFANADYVIRTQVEGVEFRNLSNAPSDQATPEAPSQNAPCGVTNDDLAPYSAQIVQIWSEGPGMECVFGISTLKDVYDGVCSTIPEAEARQTTLMDFLRTKGMTGLGFQHFEGECI